MAVIQFTALQIERSNETRVSPEIYYFTHCLIRLSNNHKDPLVFTLIFAGCRDATGSIMAETTESHHWRELRAHAGDCGEL